MSPKIFNYKLKDGFTLIELLVVMGLFAILFGFGTLSFLNLQKSANTISIRDQLIADLKGQQAKSINGATSNGLPTTHGIYIGSNRYVLFSGATFNPAENSNFTVEVPSGYSLSTSFANNQIIFNSISGEINNYSSNNNAIFINSVANNNQSPLPSISPSADSDGDGFINSLEQYVGTDLFSPCGNNAWPPDMDNNGIITSTDTNIVSQHSNARTGEPNFSTRYDLNMDGVINVLDLQIVAQLNSQSCTGFPQLQNQNNTAVNTILLNQLGVITTN